MREILGGKGANLAEMTNIGLPVPQGFTITTEACTQYYEDGREINDDIKAEVTEYIAKLEKITGKNSVIMKIHFWFRFVVVLELQCLG
jgi:pyruvate,orthophosphate dikinase